MSRTQMHEKWMQVMNMINKTWCCIYKKRINKRDRKTWGWKLLQQLNKWGMGLEGYYNNWMNRRRGVRSYYNTWTDLAKPKLNLTDHNEMKAESNKSYWNEKQTINSNHKCLGEHFPKIARLCFALSGVKVHYKVIQPNEKRFGRV